ncbi:MAG: hypothetical protein M4579_006529 [Chaenotheca gracillima]|nr:MAG: hypothetical protein M4579_006529 [Chaenotheca gracillima]
MNANGMRECTYCGKIPKTYSGLSRHLNNCKVRFGIARRKLVRREQLDIAPRAELIPDADDGWETLQDLHFEDGDGLVLSGDTDRQQPEDNAVIGRGTTAAPEANQLEGSVQHGEGLLSMSSSSSIRVETYVESTGRPAGLPIRPHELEPPAEGVTQDGRHPTDALYHPFRNAIDYGLALWFHETKCSKGAVDRFFNDRRLGPIHEQVSFNNADSWMSLIHQIQHGIPEEAWRAQDFAIQPIISSLEPSRYSIHYRDITKVLQFLIGHKPFAENLTYAPTRGYNSNNDRVFNEMHTGDWWWRTQKALPKGATVIPLLLATDKTMLTQHHGDQSVWPVYLSIGNLDRATRRKQTRPGTVLLGFIPIVHEKEEGLKSEVYHAAMEIMLKEVEEYSKDGVELECADGHVRRCYPIVAGFMTDYEEQVLITGIKSGRHCSICQVPPDERENLCQEWPKRTHESTQLQIATQSNQRRARGDDTWIHPVANFAWRHHHVNIHGGMMVDVLHQLLKGVVMHLIEWIQSLLADLLKPSQKRKRDRTNIATESATAQLDDRFRKIPRFTGLKRFNNFSQVKQWTGVEQKAIVFQLIPVVAPLLVARAPAALHFARALVDFVLLAQYRTHDEETMRYMSHALYRIDQLKGVFRDYRPADRETKEGHFNFPKFHAITHYMEFIREFGATDGFDTSHSEAAHKYLVKTFYGRTNKRDDYKEQILRHNTRRLNILAMEDIFASRMSDLRSHAEAALTPQVTQPSRPIDISKLDWSVGTDERCAVTRAMLSPKRWCWASTVAANTDIPDFLDALAVFVRESDARLGGRSSDRSRVDRLETDPSWVAGYFVTIHASIKCWKRSGKDSSNPDALVEECIRCSPAWQGLVNNWRRDYVWVQEYDNNNNDDDGDSRRLTGKLLGQLQVVLSVIDPDRLGDDRKPVVYTGALVEIFRPCNKGKPSKTHGMVEVERWPESKAEVRRNLGRRRFYDMPTILRSAHVVPASGGKFFINNYIDWDQYNTLYEPDFLEEGARVAQRYSKQLGRTTAS